MLPSLKRAGGANKSTQEMGGKKKPQPQEDKTNAPAVDFAQLVEMFTKMPDLLRQIEEAKKILLEAHTEVLEKADAVQSSFEAIKRGPPGKPGEKAVVDVEDIARRAAALVPPPKDGDTPVVDHKKIARMAAQMIEVPVAIPAKDVDPEEVVQLLKERLQRGDIVLTSKHIEGLDTKFIELHSKMSAEVEQYGKNTLKRGGGDTVAAGTNVTISTNGNGQKVINAVGAALAVITVTGTVDDSNKTFTAATKPTLLNINGAFYLPTGGSYTWTYVGTTITLNAAVGVGGSIFGI